MPGNRRSTNVRPRETQQQHQSRRLTTPRSFLLCTNTPSRPLPQRADEIELSKPFKALPLPNSSSTHSNNTLYHIHAQQQYEMARERKQRQHKDDDNGRMFKAQPLPRTTYCQQQIEKPSCKGLTVARPPRLSLVSRAEERKVFDQYADDLRRQDLEMKELREQQQREAEEEEIRHERRRYADDEDGGFCFRAREISIEYTDR